MKVPIFSLECDTLDKYQKPVIHKYDKQYYTYVHIPHYLNSNYNIFQLLCMAPKRIEIKLNPYTDREPNKPWIRIISDILDWDIGLHIYQLSLVNKYSNDVVSVYFGYIVQDDDPEKPYIYMNREICREEDKW